MLDSTNSLTKSIEAAGNSIIDPSMTKIQDLLNSIARDFKWDPTRKEIEESYLDISKAKIKMRRLRDDLNVLADSTIIKVETITMAIDGLTEDASEEELDFDFQTMVRNFIAFLNYSKERLQGAQAKYTEVQDAFVVVAAKLNTYRNDIESLLKDEDNKLTNFVNDYRAKNYGIAAACVLNRFLCPFIYFITTIATEATVAGAKKDLEHLKNNANKAIDAVKLSDAEIHNAFEFIGVELPLIMRWSDRLDETSNAIHSVDHILRAIKLGRHIAIKKALVNLSGACENYLKNNEGGTSRMYA